MKTIKILKSEMEDIKSDMKREKEADTKESLNRYKKLNAKLSHLKLCLMYLESEPTVEFITKEKDRLTNRVNKLMDLYVEPVGWLKTLKLRHKRDYEKEMGIPKLRKQLSTLYFLLK